MTEPGFRADPSALTRPDAAELEVGRHLFAQECRFIASADSLPRLPPMSATEVAFAGRSNVGKSSLVNALTGRRTLARTSSTPGRTQTLVFFRLGAAGGPWLDLVDLPGYGYARASKSLIKSWTALLRGYLRGRSNLGRVCLLIDARHGLKPPDRDLMALLDRAAVPYQAVLTKADKVGEAELADGIGQLCQDLKAHAAAFPDPLVTSVRSGLGIAHLRAALAALAQPVDRE